LLTAEAGNVSGESDYSNYNTDVIVLIEQEDNHCNLVAVKYVATFFTYDNIEELKAIHHKSGEYLNGKYFFFKNMVLINNCSKNNITEVVNHLIEEGDFSEVFRRV